MPYVMTENGNIKIGTNGHPLVTEDGNEKEFEIDAIAAGAKIGEISAEAKKYRTERNDYRDKFEPFKDLDLSKANEALQLVENMGDDHKVEMTNLKETLTEAWQGKVSELEANNKELSDKLFESNVVAKIRSSDLIDTTHLPASIFVSTFKDQFQQDGSATHWDGRTILAKENPSENASTQEALAVLLNTHPERDKLLKSSGAHSGASNNQEPSGGRQPNVNKSSFDKINSGLQNL